MEISVFTFLCYPGSLMYRSNILVFLYVLKLVYKINQIKIPISAYAIKHSSKLDRARQPI